MKQLKWKSLASGLTLALISLLGDSLVWAGTYSLPPGTTLSRGQAVTLGDLFLSMQGDGNLCLYKVQNGQYSGLWCAAPKCAYAYNQTTNPDPCGANPKMTFQGDGNISLTSAQGYYWGSGPTSPYDSMLGPGSQLVLSDDAPYLSIKHGASTLWTGSNQFGATIFLYSGEYLHFGDLYLNMQTDGNLCLRRKMDNAGDLQGLVCLQMLPSSSGAIGSNLHIAFQTDGNLALYDNNSNYYGGTGATAPGSKLVFSENAPYLLILGAQGQTLWPAPNSAPPQNENGQVTVSFPLIADPSGNQNVFGPFYNGKFMGGYLNQNLAPGESQHIDLSFNTDKPGQAATTKVLKSVSIAINANGPDGKSYGIEEAGLDICVTLRYPNLGSGLPVVNGRVDTAPPPATATEVLCQTQVMTKGQWPQQNLNIDFTNPVSGARTQGLLVPPGAMLQVSAGFTVTQFASGVSPVVTSHIIPGTTQAANYRIGSDFKYTLNLADYDPAQATAGVPAVQSVRIPLIDTTFMHYYSPGGPGTPWSTHTNLGSVPLRTFGQWVYSQSAALHFRGTQNNGKPAAITYCYHARTGTVQPPAPNGECSPEPCELDQSKSVYGTCDRYSATSFFPWNLTLKPGVANHKAADYTTSYCKIPSNSGKICAFYTLLEVPAQGGTPNPAPFVPGHTITPKSATSYCNATTAYYDAAKHHYPYILNDMRYHDTKPNSGDGKKACMNYLLQR